MLKVYDYGDKYQGEKAMSFPLDIGNGIGAMLEMREQRERRKREETGLRNERTRREKKEKKMLKGGNTERGQCSQEAILKRVQCLRSQ